MRLEVKVQLTERLLIE